LNFELLLLIIFVINIQESVSHQFSKLAVLMTKSRYSSFKFSSITFPSEIL